jgi:hypothetical protein
MTILEADLFQIPGPCLFGYWIYRTRREDSSRWVWIAALVWFSGGVYRALGGNHGVIWEISGPPRQQDITESFIT